MDILKRPAPQSVWFQSPRHVDRIDFIPSVADSTLGQSGSASSSHQQNRSARKKTVSVALVMCLNIGVDPPDVVKPNPSARLQCWLDPLCLGQQKGDQVAVALQQQYERWQPRARYKPCVDPTGEGVKKLCTSLRRNARDERILLHYNGHGVPKPTNCGEIWVFNEKYTQYIPLSVVDLHLWMGSPSIYVYDCSNAGQILESFNQLVVSVGECRDGSTDGTKTNPVDCIMLAACSKGQNLPMNPAIPADIFTCCLTTPIKTACLWFALYRSENYLSAKLTRDDSPSEPEPIGSSGAAPLPPTPRWIDDIPGQLTDRKTMLGELNWVFTAITDTIAWNTLKPELFQRLFRQDLLVASLFRNFLLADRIMRQFGCAPVSDPILPPTHDHPLWKCWDFALDVCINKRRTTKEVSLQSQPVPRPLSEQQSYSNSPFFANQLSAFDSWLLQGNDGRSFPEQLPIVLQVLLSSVHRQRALHLLGRFLDLGDWAVHLALSVGIFPYVLKLLQSSTSELRPLLAFIWAKILAVDLSCQNDLIRDKGHEYFLKILRDPHSEIRDKTISAFILTSLMNKCEAAQRALMQNQYIGLCSDLLFDEKASVCPWLRRWLIIGLGRIWNDFDPARWQAVRSVTYDHLYTFLSDPVPEVRAAAVYALGTLISNQSNQNDHATNVEINIAEMLVTVCQHDGSALVRGELIVSLHHFVLDFEKKFVKIAQELYDTVAARMQEQQQQQQSMRASNSMMNMSAESDPDTPSPSFLPARFPSVRRLSSTTEAQEDTNTDLFPISPLPDNIRRSSSMRSVEASPSGSRNARLPPVDSIFVGSPPESRNDTITTLLQTAAQGTGSPGSAVTSGRRRRSPHSRRTRPNATLLRQRHLVIEIMHHMADNNITTMKYHLNIWRCFINAMFDPHHDVMTDAIKLVNYITRKIKHGEPIPGVSEQSGSSTWTAKHTTTRPSVSPGTFLPPSLPKVTISKAQFTVGSPPDTDGLSRSPAGPSSLGSSPVPTMIHRPGGGGILATVQKNIVTGHIMVSQPRQSARHVKADKPVRHANQHSISSDTTCDDTTPAIDQTDGGIAQSSTSAAVAVQNGETPNKTANGACVSRKPIIFSKFADWSTSKFAAHVSTMLDACTHFEGFTRPRLPVPLWARQGFDKVCDEMQSEEIAINNGATVDSQYFMTRHGGLQQADRQDSLTSISFHPVLPLMLVSQSDTINLWNTDRSCKLAYMHNHHSVLTQLSMVKIINPLTHGHIMTGTTDGRVKVWDTRFGQFLEPGFLTKDDEYSPRLLGAWDATGDLRRISPSNTMKDSTIYSWDQDNGTLLLSGNVRVLRVWNVDREQKVCDLPLGMRDPKTEEQLMATCLSADGNMAAVGSENGFVRLFDTRLPSNSSNITTFRHQRAKLLHVQIREQDSSHVERVVTGSADGRLIVYEPRMYKEPIVDYCLSSTVGQCITMSSHARLPLIATATSSAGVQIYDYNARRVAGTIRYNEGFMAHRLGLVSTMSFHPFTSKIAIGGRDNAIMVYGVDRGALSPVPD